MDKRKTGILLAVSSLPGSLGIGDFGSSAYVWVDRLKEAKVALWQILPLNPLGYGNSPYQPYSSFAGDEIYISIEKLYEALNLSFDAISELSVTVDYETVRLLKDQYLRHAYDHFVEDVDYTTYCETTDWLEEYATFMALRKHNGLVAWTHWQQFTVDGDEVKYQKFLQYHFSKQWFALKAYANENGIDIMGDIPIYIGHDSADVYFNRKLFHLNDDGSPQLVAGVPPDYFSETGQLWGNPLYDWDAMSKDHYEFWAKRIRWNQELFNVIRVDHFRAFDTYWAIKAQEMDARDGEWLIGPKKQFFDAMLAQVGNLSIVVEDLGDLREEVHELRDYYNFMGMQIIQFTLDDTSIEQSKDLKENLLVYTGTHDNQTLAGFLDSLPASRRKEIYSKIASIGIHESNPIDQLCMYALSLKANWVIVPIQDILRLGDIGRLNTPGTVGSPNWEWKLRAFDGLFDVGISRLKSWIEATNRDSYGYDV